MEYIIRWRNQSGVKESGMSKWILQLRDDKATPIKTVEDTTASNLENFSDVQIRLPLTYEETMRQTTTNKMLIYFDSVRDSTKLGELTVLFDRTRVPINIDRAATTTFDTQGYDFKIPNTTVMPEVRGLDAKKYTNYFGDEYLHTRPFYLKFSTNAINAVSIFIYSERVEGYIMFLDKNNRPLGMTISGEPSRTEIDPSTIYRLSLAYYLFNQTSKQKEGPYGDYIQNKKDLEYWISVFIGRPYTIPPPPSPPPPVIPTSKPVTTNNRCGPDHGHAICKPSNCCSVDGWCGGYKGTYSSYCSKYDYIDEDGTYYQGGLSDYDWDKF